MLCSAQKPSAVARAGVAGGETDCGALALHSIDQHPCSLPDTNNRGTDHFDFLLLSVDHPKPAQPRGNRRHSSPSSASRFSDYDYSIDCLAPCCPHGQIIALVPKLRLTTGRRLAAQHRQERSRQNAVRSRQRVQYREMISAVHRQQMSRKRSFGPCPAILDRLTAQFGQFPGTVSHHQLSGRSPANAGPGCCVPPRPYRAPASRSGS